jgi:hypothetical protein
MMIARRTAISLCLMLAACSSDPDLPTPVYVPPSPPTENAIALNVETVAGQAKLASPLQVSDVRPTEHGPGRYYVCVREANPPPDSRPRYYAVFFENDTYKGDRLSVMIDQCEAQTFRTLPASTPATPATNVKRGRRKVDRGSK